jgi:Domain of unknown function (DUF4350)
MSLMSGISSRDRGLALLAMTLVLAMIVTLAVLSPQGDNDPTPSSYGTGNHGAKAAYLTLERAGYQVERWSDPLATLADRADGHAVLILAAPFAEDLPTARAALSRFLEHHGHIVAMGGASTLLLPDASIRATGGLTTGCALAPVGFDLQSAAERVHMHAALYWSAQNPLVRVQYTCEQRPVVVTYPSRSGLITWWSDTYPLENRGISEGDNLQLLLSSIGPPSNAHIYWDESLHGASPSLWSYARGTPFHLALLQLAFAASLLLFSYSRRHGPLRPDPVASRGSSAEFVVSLGGLFHKAHASGEAVAIAYQHLRRHLQARYAIPLTLSAEAAARALHSRGVSASPNLGRDLRTAEAAGESLSESRALALVQTLEQHQRALATS